jgi:tetrahydromethanopterin S-methyltransferase subunit C
VSATDQEIEQPQSTERAAPPAGEEIHLPGPSVLPFVTAIGITLAVIGTTIDWKIWSSMGVLITVVCAVIWVRDTRRDVASLPEEHHH